MSLILMKVELCQNVRRGSQREYHSSQHPVIHTLNEVPTCVIQKAISVHPTLLSSDRKRGRERETCASVWMCVRLRDGDRERRRHQESEYRRRGGHSSVGPFVI